jgi:hypothetical protein
VTIKLKVAAPEGKGVITGYTLPSELAAGEWITGQFTIRNDGGDDTMALVLKTEWDGKYYGSTFDLVAGKYTIIALNSGVIAMPNQDAVITIYACHAQPGGELNIGGVAFKIDDTKTH